MTRNFAERARGFACCSTVVAIRDTRIVDASGRAPHPHGKPGGHVHPPVTARRSVRFTMRSSPEWCEQVDCRFKRRLKNLEFIVDCNSYRLEGALCRVATTATRGSGYRHGDHIG